MQIYNQSRCQTKSQNGKLNGQEYYYYLRINHFADTHIIGYIFPSL